MPSSWVLSLSFDFFIEFWRKWLEFWLLIKILNAVLHSFVGPLGLSICNSSKYTINETFYTKNLHQKCRNFELFSWVLSYYLEVWVFFILFTGYDYHFWGLLNYGVNMSTITGCFFWSDTAIHYISQLVEKMELCSWLHLIALEKRFFMSFWY